MSIYEEKPIKEVKKPSDINRPNTWRECDYGVNVEEGVVYLTGDIDEHTGHEFIARTRTALLNRPQEKQDDPWQQTLMQTPLSTLQYSYYYYYYSYFYYTLYSFSSLGFSGW